MSEREDEAWKARHREELYVEANRVGIDREAFVEAVVASNKSHNGGFGDGYTLNLAKSIAAYLEWAKSPQPMESHSTTTI